MLLRILKPFVIVGFVFGSTAAFAAAQQPQAASQQATPAPSGEAASGKTPKATAEGTEKGQLKSPYQDFAKVADEGHKKFMAAGCNGCHGGGGGGGMGPPLTNEVWIYGKDDDTLFRPGGARQRRAESPRLRPQGLGERRWTDARHGRDRQV